MHRRILGPAGAALLSGAVFLPCPRALPQEVAVRDPAPVAVSQEIPRLVLLMGPGNDAAWRTVDDAREGVPDAARARIDAATATQGIVVIHADDGAVVVRLLPRGAAGIVAHLCERIAQAPDAAASAALDGMSPDLRHVALLDVAAGSAYVPAAAREEALRRIAVRSGERGDEDRVLDDLGIIALESPSSGARRLAAEEIAAFGGGAPDGVLAALDGDATRALRALEVVRRTRDGAAAVAILDVLRRRRERAAREALGVLPGTERIAGPRVGRAGLSPAALDPAEPDPAPPVEPRSSSRAPSLATAAYLGVLNDLLGTSYRSAAQALDDPASPIPTPEREGR